MPTRRTFIRSSSAAVVALLAGCSTDPPQDATGSSATPATTAAQPETDDLLAEVAPDRTSELQVINASFETLTGDGRIFAFGLVGADNTPVTGADVEVWTRAEPGEPPTGPVAASFTEIPNQPLGLYVVRLDLPAPGAIPLAALTADGAAGQTALRVADPDNATVPAPGVVAPVVRTPTPDDQLGFERICTLDPPCGMHEDSLDDLIAAGTPVMLTIATPAFCETAICGPTVDVIESVRTGRADEDVAWVHLEVFTDAGLTVADQVTEWNLPSEPWLFGIDGDGMIAGRLDGPLTVLPQEIGALADQLA
ncbi:hypothetical protein [Euzebya tangerina]|uniref:hypothetical protein n=1 Tax=Euzebya tangerina TaxID=591198 RepID=UPI000E319E05|nr:hypothetical protein [Euzebya tangerina]